jgi:hypothetical protein
MPRKILREVPKLRARKIKGVVDERVGGSAHGKPVAIQWQSCVN